jgi:hypothetical protein
MWSTTRARVQRIIRIACAPLAFAAALGALPHLELVPLVGLIHALYLIDGGAHPLLGVLHAESAQFTVVSALIAGGGLWALGAAGAAAGLL